MRSPIVALIWETWKREQKAAWAVVGILVMCSLASAILPVNAWAIESLEVIYYLLMVCSFILLFGILTHTEFNPKKSWHGFPYRLFALPVSTRTLVAVPMLVGFVVIEIVYLIWAKLVFAPFGREISLWPALVLGGGVVSYQTLVWSLAGYRITRIVALGFAGLIFLNFVLIPMMPELLNDASIERVRRILAVVLGGLVAASFLICWFCVEKQRRGGGRGRGWFRAKLGVMVDALPRRRRDFSTPAAAQFWFEWRRTGWVLPACVAFVLAIIFTPVSLLTRDDPADTLWTMGWALALPIILGGVIGKGFGGLELESVTLSMPSFIAVRPITSGEMVIAKLKVAVWSVFLAWLLVLIFLALWLPLWANLTQLKELWEAAIILHGPVMAYAIACLFVFAGMILTWRGMVSSMWSGLSGSKKRHSIAMVAHFVFLVTAIVGIVYWARHFQWDQLERYVSWAEWSLLLAVMTKLWLAVFSWRKINPARALRYTSIWLAGTICFVVLGLMICPDVFWLQQLVILAALLPFPLARLGLAPSAISNSRHQI